MANISKEERARRQEQAGIPDSKVFASPGPESPTLNCHVGGMLVRDMPLETQSRIVYRQTDEGIAEFNQGKSERRAEVISDEFHTALTQRKDDVLDRDMDLYEARNPLKEVADQFVAPGMRGKFLSAASVKDAGGTGDYVVVKYPDGHPLHGEPVKVKGMILGEMPERRAIAKNKHFRERGNQLLKQIEQKHQADGGSTDQNTMTNG